MLAWLDFKANIGFKDLNINFFPFLCCLRGLRAYLVNNLFAASNSEEKSEPSKQAKPKKKASLMLSLLQHSEETTSRGSAVSKIFVC